MQRAIARGHKCAIQAVVATQRSDKRLTRIRWQVTAMAFPSRLGINRTVRRASAGSRTNVLLLRVYTYALRAAYLYAVDAVCCGNFA